MWTFESCISKNVYILLAKKSHNTLSDLVVKTNDHLIFGAAISSSIYTLSHFALYPHPPKVLGKAGGPFSGLMGPLSH